MATLNSDIRKFKKLEFISVLLYIFCAGVTLFFVIAYLCARRYDVKTLQLICLILCPVLCTIGTFASAILSYAVMSKFTKEIKRFVLEVFVENAHLMHPDKKSLSFDISFNDAIVEIGVNGYKEKIIFDLSPLKKLSFTQKRIILSEIQTMLIVAFCRLVDGGSTYADVDYAINKRKVKIITGGLADKRAYRVYLKNRNNAGD